MTPQLPNNDPTTEQLPQTPPAPPPNIPQQRAYPPPQITPRPKRKTWPFLVAAFVVLGLFALGVAAVTSNTNDPQRQGTAQGFDPSKGTYPGSPAGSSNRASGSVPRTTAQPAAPDPVERFSGRGDDVITLATPRDVAILDFDCKSCTGNVILKSDGDLHVNTIGAYSGKTIYGQVGGSTTQKLTRLQITAKGAWTLAVGGVDTARQASTFPIDGSGDDAVLVENANDVATISYTGKSGNFAVWATHVSAGTDLVVNEIGAYTGKVILPGKGRTLITVKAKGNWSIT